MPQQEPVILSQPKNTLSSIADDVRRKLLTKNDYSVDKNEYSSTNKDAISDGDVNGKGTGFDTSQDVSQGGSSADIKERNVLITKNEYKSVNPYTTPSI
jgi:hypothetical protein